MKKFDPHSLALAAANKILDEVIRETPRMVNHCAIGVNTKIIEELLEKVVGKVNEQCADYIKWQIERHSPSGSPLMSKMPGVVDVLVLLERQIRGGAAQIHSTTPLDSVREATRPVELVCYGQPLKFSELPVWSMFTEPCDDPGALQPFFVKIEEVSAESFVPKSPLSLNALNLGNESSVHFAPDIVVIAVKRKEPPFTTPLDSSGDGK